MPNEHIRALRVGSVVPGDGREGVVVRTNYRLMLLRINGEGEPVVIASKAMYDQEKVLILIADVDGDGVEDVISGEALNVWESSQRWDFDVFDAHLELLSEWSVDGAVDAVEPWLGDGGAAMLVMLERDSQSAVSTRLVWRDGVSGRSIYKSPGVDANHSELNVFADAHTGKMHAVINSGNRIYITQ